MAIHDIRQLEKIGSKSSRLIIGLMSGTSLDGLDIALCRIRGSGTESRVEVIKFETHPYPEAFISDIREVFAKAVVSLEKLCLLNARIAAVHVGLILTSIEKWGLTPSGIDCIASHGQTVYHAPRRLHKLETYPNATLQIGDGDHIAVKTGIITISDFRQKHVAAGGEGAPLALYGDYLLFSSPTENRILLNIGGIANFTFLPAGRTSDIISTDTGPGNTLLDALAKKYFGVPYDENGAIALRGTVNDLLLNALLEHTFFSESLPKTTGPELFNLKFVEDAVERAGVAGIGAEDLLCTVARLTSLSIANAIKSLNEPDLVIYISGGGCYNAAVVEGLRVLLKSVQIKEFIELGVDPDAKEAVLFAVLANECLAGSATHIGVTPAVTMGKISLPG